MNRAVFFADVHGNITGLRAVLDEVGKLENVMHVVALGDYFGWSAGHNDILDLCQARGVTLIRGGHEQLLKIIDDGQDEGRYYPEVYFTHDWLKRQLRPEYYEMLPRLPMEFQLKLNQHFLLVAFHAAPGDMEAYTCGSDRPLQVLRDTYGALEQNVVVYGHYHEPHVLPMDGKLLINCAAVGMRKQGALSNYTVIEYDEEKIAVIQKQAPYDRAEEDELVLSRGMIRRLG